jgi:beta-lactamase regulating signal transducer with metallopeptidase domain
MTPELLLHAARIVFMATGVLAATAMLASRLMPACRARERHDFALAALVVVPFVFSIALAPVDRDASQSLGNTATGYFAAIAHVWLVALLPALLPIWAIGSICLLARLAIDLRAVLALRARARPVPIPEGLRVSRPVVVRRSTEIVSPMLIGYRHPTIVVPEEFDLDAAAVPIIEHEIAHAQRGDNWTAVAIRILAALLWWNAPLYLLRRIIERAREELCDDCAVAITGSPRQLAQALLDTAADAAKARRGLSAATSGGALAARVARLTSSDAGRTGPPLLTFAALAPLLGAAALIAVTSSDALSSRSTPWARYPKPGFREIILNPASTDTAGSWHCGLRDVLVRGECYFVVRGANDVSPPESSR